MRPETTSPMGERWAIASSPPAKVGTKPATVQHGSCLLCGGDRDMHMSKGCAITVSEGGITAGDCRTADMPPSGQVQTMRLSARLALRAAKVWYTVAGRRGDRWLLYPLRQMYSCAVLCCTRRGHMAGAPSCSPWLAGWLIPADVAAEQRHALCVKATTTAVTSSALAASSACHRCHASSTNCAQG